MGWSCFAEEVNDPKEPYVHPTYVCQIVRASEELHVEVMLPEDLTEDEAAAVAEFIRNFPEKHS